MKDMDKLVGTTWAKAFGHPQPVGFHDSRQLFAHNLNRLKKECALMNFDEPGKVSSADRTSTHLFICGLDFEDLPTGLSLWPFVVISHEMLFLSA